MSENKNESRPSYVPSLEGRGADQDVQRASLRGPAPTGGDTGTRGRSGRRWLSRVLLVVGVLFCGFAAARLIPAWFGHRSGDHRHFKPIAQIQVGERVQTEGPGRDQDMEFGDDVDPAAWRKVELVAPKSDGSTAEVVLLRPAIWLEEERAEVGGMLDLEYPECGIDGDATILAIGPCPPIKRGSGGVVTGTFKHRSAQVINVSVEGETQPIGVTPSHLFWSNDRNVFVRADQLRPGEKLWGNGKHPRVERVEVRAAGEAVYNLEVQMVHVYHVSGAGLLVHNTAPCPRTNRILENAGIGTVTDAVALNLEALARKNDRLSLIRELMNQDLKLAATDAGALQIERAADRLLQEAARRYDFGALLTRLRGGPGDINHPHAHHILFKRGRGAAQQELVTEGQQILRSVGIDPIYGVENLVWAPNIKGQHTLVNLQEVVTALRNLKAEGGTRIQFTKLLQKLGKKAAGLE